MHELSLSTDLLLGMGCALIKREYLYTHVMEYYTTEKMSELGQDIQKAKPHKYNQNLARFQVDTAYKQYRTRNGEAYGS